MKRKPTAAMKSAAKKGLEMHAAGTTHGAGHRYAIEYEFDASQVPDVVANP